MTLIKYYKPEFEFSPFNSVLDRLLALEGAGRTEKKMITPQIDIAETDKNFIISLTVPGVKKEDLKIEVNEDKLTISGERKSPEGDVSVKYHKVQTAFGEFKETFTLPKDVDKEGIQAKQEDGVLTIFVNKIEKKEKKSVIEVK